MIGIEQIKTLWREAEKLLGDDTAPLQMIDPLYVSPLEMPRQQEGLNTRTLQDYLGHRNIEHTVRYTKLSSSKFKNLWPN